MKVEVSSPKEKKFEPITLAITIETRDELLDMYVRTRMNNNKVVDHINDTYNSRQRGVSKATYINAIRSISEDGDEVPLLVELRHLVDAL